MNNAKLFLLAILVLNIWSCQSDDDSNSPGTGGENEGTLHLAFSEFNSEAYTILLDGDEVIIETNDLPNHTSPYWSNTTGRMGTPPSAVDHPLFVEPTVTSHENMAPGNIDDFTGLFQLTVPANPQKASSASRTGLGPIGLAVSGAVIYNDQEGPNNPIDDALPSLDYSAAHTGPQSYHYHLEPKAWSDDDDVLIGIISDGFFIYGRKCSSTGDYPTDLDESGGHTHATQHSEGEEEYHYHIKNERYLNQYYIIFPDDYQGTPNAIN
ncbi:MAG: YHYH protein [Bacteroidota bacterium]